METTPSQTAEHPKAGPPASLLARRGVPATVEAIVARLRRRWKLRLLLQGLAVSLALGGLLFIAAAWLLNLWHFSAPAVWSLRLLTLAVCVALLLRYCVMPLRRRIADSRVALYLEEHEPSLRGLLSSAVDARRLPADSVSPQLAARLAEQAVDACRKLHFGDSAEARKLGAAVFRLGLVVLAAALLVLWPPQFLQFGAPALLQPWTDASEYSPYRIELTPGDIEIAHGADQLISASITGYDGGDILLFTSRDGGRSWQQQSMAAGNARGVYESFLFDLDSDLDYYVAGAGQQTPTYRIAVAQIPVIEQIGLRFHYPAYTMLPAETRFGNGDIRALEGTRVEVLIEPSIEIPGGELLFDDGRSVALEPVANGGWVGELVVQQAATYRVRLQRASGALVDASPEYRIAVIDDQHPSVSILSPGRDTKVSMVEEPLMRIRASDDQGIADLQLVMSVNGAAEKSIDLLPSDGGENRQQIEAEHVIYLEDLGLQPGDLISYYVRARELAPETQHKTATSDIFFYQVRPFSMNYRSAAERGGGGGGGQQGGEQQGHLSEQQKQFVVATFKMIRDRDSYQQETWNENLELLANAEARIRDRVEAIVRRIGRRPIVQSDERYQVVMRELPLATEAMIEVENLLRQAEIETALSDAQRALLHLQRADAAFREINVSLASQGGGGGGNSGSNELADLFQLEMDKLRNQYETVQRGQQQAPQQVIDEALERLRELAQRQQREVERQIRRLDQGLGSEAASRQRALAEELEEMARQLERLTREQHSQRLQQSIAQMRKAAESMRRAAANAEAGSGASDAQAAEESLREARRLLDQGRAQQISEAVERSLRRAELAEKKQAVIKREVASIDDPPGSDLEQKLDRLQQRKQSLSDELAHLESELGELTGEAREEQPEAAEALKQALESGHDNRVQDRIGRTRRMMELGARKNALQNEEHIQRSIGRMREHIEEALAQIGEPAERGLQRSLEQMRDLARELRFSRERAQNAADGERQAPANQASADGNRQAAENSASAGAGDRDRQTQGNSTPTGGAANGGYADGSSGYAVTGVQPLRRNLDSIAKRTRELGHRLARQGVDSGDIEPVLARIDELTRASNLADSAALHDDALLALMELEYRLRQQLEGTEVPQLLLSESADVPEDYAEMVADYFRRLSRP
jgi:hypothetical protein